MTDPTRRTGPRRFLGPWPALGLVILLLAWTSGHRVYGSLVLPGVGETFAALARLAVDGDLWPALAATAVNAGAGFLVGGGLGALLGGLAGLREEARATLQPLAVVLVGVPAIAWVVLALLWFGGRGAPVFTVAVATGPVVFAAATQGVRTLDGELLRMARSFRVPRSALFADLYLPHLLGHLFPALATALAMSWKVSVMAEVLAGAGGIGDAIATARARVDTAETMAWVLVVVILLLVVDQGLLQPLQRRVELWRDAGDGGRR